MVPSATVHDHSYASSPTIIRQAMDHATNRKQDSTTSETPVYKQVETDGFLYLKTELQNQGILPVAALDILKGWRDSTKSQYRLYFRKWIRFC